MFIISLPTRSGGRTAAILALKVLFIHIRNSRVRMKLELRCDVIFKITSMSTFDVFKGNLD